MNRYLPITQMAPRPAATRGYLTPEMSSAARTVVWFSVKLEWARCAQLKRYAAGEGLASAFLVWGIGGKAHTIIVVLGYLVGGVGSGVGDGGRLAEFASVEAVDGVEEEGGCCGEDHVSRLRALAAVLCSGNFSVSANFALCNSLIPGPGHSAAHPRL